MRDVALLVLDFDGVLTDNRVQVHQSGEESVWCHRGDGWGIARLKDAGLEVVVISTEANPVVSARCRKLCIDALQGCDDKLASLQALARERGLAPRHIAYVGNDLNDLTCMQWVGWPIAVADAVSEIRLVARWITHLPGGYGAVREVSDRWLESIREADTPVDAAKSSIWRSMEITRTIAGSAELLADLISAARTMSAVLAAGRRVFFVADVASTALAHYVAGVIEHGAPEHGVVPPIVLTVNGRPAGSALPDDLLPFDGQARVGDMAVGITVAPDSPGLLSAMHAAGHAGLHTLALTGADSGHLSGASDVCISVPFADTRTIQDAHLLVARVLTDHLARELLPMGQMTFEGGPTAIVE